MEQDSVLVSTSERRLAEAYVSRGMADRRDSTLLARTDRTEIWQTEKVSASDPPRWPPGSDPDAVIYRGFPLSKLKTVLETGLDLPAHVAFFATQHRSKAWEYPTGRSTPALLIYDRERTERSFMVQSGKAGDTCSVDKTRYPNVYVDADIRVHTRFAADHGTRTFADESMYGFWIPGDARDALLGIVLGGTHASVVQLLDTAVGDIGVPIYYKER